MKNEKLIIEGMGCNHCVMAVKKELEKLDLIVQNVNIGSAEINYEQGKVNSIDLEKAIERAGYELKEVQSLPAN